MEINRKITVAATQMSCSWNRKENIEKAEKLVREAVSKGAKIVLLQELFETPYFCQVFPWFSKTKKEKQEYFELAREAENNPTIRHFQNLAKELSIVIPIR